MLSRPGPYALVATAAHLLPATSYITIHPELRPIAALAALAPATPVVTQAGASVTLSVHVMDGKGRLVSSDTGRKFSMSITGLTPSPTVLLATDRHGVAAFEWQPLTPGEAFVSVAASGLTGTRSIVQVVPANTGATALTLLQGSSLMGADGWPLSITVGAVNASGQVATADTGRVITAVLRSTAGGVPTQTALTAKDVSGVATFTWPSAALGTYSLEVSAPGLSRTSGSVKIAPPPTVLTLSTPSVRTLAGTSVPIQATLTEPDGTFLPASVPISLRLAPGSVGQLVNTTSVLPVTGNPATTFEAGDLPGSAMIVAQAGDLSAKLTLTVLPVDVMAFTGSPFNGIAGTQTTVTVTLSPIATMGTSPQGPLPVTLTITPPASSPPNSASTTGVQGTTTSTSQPPVPPTTTVTAQAIHGVATFSVVEDRAGTYTLTAAAADATPVTSWLNVVAGPPANLAASATPKSVAVGGLATIRVQAVDAYGNAILKASPFPVGVALAAPAVGTIANAAAQPEGPGVIAQFRAESVGTATIVVTTSTGVKTSLTIPVTSSRIAALTGKGMWLMWGDWSHVGSAQIVQTALQDHIHTLYLEVATTHDGFYGHDAMDDLLPAAHAAHLAVIAWVYTALYHPAADAATTEAVARYQTPTGQSVDGIAADIEAVTTPQAVSAYAKAVRAALPNELLAAVTYPPLYHMSYPYSSLAPYVDAIEPMDYWHSMPKSYSESYVLHYVKQSVDTIRELDGNPSLPIAVIGQAYDMFTSSGSGSNNPTPAEITGGFQASEQDGAVGFSLYRWGTATQAEWQLWANLEWTP